MSNIYILEPPTNGKVLLKTTVGDIDIELWSKEAPLACKNFVQLCLEGYYDNTIFHRVVKDFIVQGGDPTGTGTGGESVYGSPFKDEFHSRLKFNRRGLVAMANAGKNDNASQFFFTLGSTPELQNKHTIFGKIGGKTIYNMIKLEEGEIDHDERPVYPNKIISTDVISNPFSDIVPRQKMASDAEVKPAKKKTPQAVKNFKLLSFGEEAEDDEGEVYEINQKFHGKKKFNPIFQETDQEELEEETNKRKHDTSDSEDEPQVKRIIPDKQETADSSLVDKIRDKLNPNKKSSAPPEIKEDNFLKLKWDKDDAPGEETTKKKSNALIDEYVKEKSKYSDMKKNLPKKGESREKQTLEMLKKFRQKINNLQQKISDNDEAAEEEEAEKAEGDSNWLVHSLKCEDSVVLAKDANTKDDDWFEITDPRNALNKRRRENSKIHITKIKEGLS